MEISNVLFSQFDRRDMENYCSYKKIYFICLRHELDINSLNDFILRWSWSRIKKKMGRAPSVRASRSQISIQLAGCLLSGRTWGLQSLLSNRFHCHRWSVTRISPYQPLYIPRPPLLNDAVSRAEITVETSHPVEAKWSATDRRARVKFAA